MEGNGSSQRFGFPRNFLGLVAVIIAIAALAVSLLSLEGNRFYVAGTAPSTGATSSTGASSGGGTVSAGANTTTASTTVHSEQQAGSTTGAPVIDTSTGQQVGVKCPADYCLNPEQGAGKCPDGSTYNEQECYKYPATASSLAQCESQKQVYYKVCGK